MNLIETFQDLVDKVPELVQPIIVALAGAVPFIEGEGAVTIGIMGGVHPLVAALAATLGSFICVFIIVQLSAGARQAILTRRGRSGLAVAEGSASVADPAPESARKAARRAKFQRSFDRYGVPGVSLLGPLLLPPMFTAPMLIAVGVEKSRVLLWQAMGIMLWVAICTVLFTAVLATVR